MSETFGETGAYRILVRKQEFLVYFQAFPRFTKSSYAQFPLLRSELRFATVWTYVGSRGKLWPKP